MAANSFTSLSSSLNLLLHASSLEESATVWSSFMSLLYNLGYRAEDLAQAASNYLQYFLSHNERL